MVHHIPHAFRCPAIVPFCFRPTNAPAAAAAVLVRPLSTAAVAAAATTTGGFVSTTSQKVRAKLTARIEQLDRGRSNTEAWVKALRHDLAAERATREAAEARLVVVSDRAEVCVR